jgi:hypothetical protein
MSENLGSPRKDGEGSIGKSGKEWGKVCTKAIVSGEVEYTLPTADGTASQVLSTDGAGTLSWAAAGAATALDDIGDPDANTAVTLGTYTTTLTSTKSTAGGVLTIENTTADLGADVSLLDLKFTDDGDANGYFLRGYDNSGGDLKWSIGADGAASFGSMTFTSGMTASGGTVSVNADSNNNTNINTGTSTGTVTIGNNSASVAIASSAWDMSGAGALSGITTLSLSDDITMANGKGVKSSTTTAQTVGVYGYDNNAAAYVGALVVTNGDTPATVLGNVNGTTEITSSDWAISTAGAMTGIGAITMDGALTVNNASIVLYNNEAITLSHSTNGAADDLTISLTGATDSSILISSTGTGADAIGLSATAGTIKIAGDQLDLDSTNDINITVTSSTAGEDLLLNQVGANDSSITLTAAGTGTDAIGLQATAGGIDVDAAASFDIDISGGQVAISSKDNAASAIALTANVGVTETIVVTNTQGTSESAITLNATAGGVNIDAAAAKDLDLAGGQVKLVSKDNAASAISLTANIGTSETIVVTNTQGTDAGAITLTATAGGITAAVATGKAITLNGTTNLKVGSNVASPAGGELDIGDGNYFYITGTNNITSIAAGDSTAGRLCVFRFADVLTFTDGNNLKLAGNMSTTADDTITLICDGTNWYEIARSAN